MTRFPTTKAPKYSDAQRDWWRCGRDPGTGTGSMGEDGDDRDKADASARGGRGFQDAAGTVAVVALI